MPFTYIVNFTVAPANIEKAKELSLQLREKTVLEPGCRQYVFHQCIDEPNRFFIYEAYDDRAALDTHQASDYFRKCVIEGMRPIQETCVSKACTPLG